MMKAFKLQAVVFMAVAALLVCAAPKAQAEAPWLQQIVNEYLAAEYPSQPYAGINTGANTMPGAVGDEILGAGLFTLANTLPGTQLRAEVAGYKDKNQLNWYTTDSAMGAIKQYGTIFKPLDSPYFSTDFSPVGGTYLGFYIISPSGVFYSETGRNTMNYQNFRVFEDPNYKADGNKYIFGVEDVYRGDRDYNDMVFTISKINAVPEPASMTLLGLGLMGAFGFARRKLVK